MADKRIGKAALTLAAVVAAGSFYRAAAESQPLPTSLARPDVSTWPTIGSTMRTDPAKPTIPAQHRQVQMDPRGYARFVATRAFADGTSFAVVFYSVALDTTHAPPLYHASKEVAFAMEVIDRRHPDGRRFYTFAPGAERAAPLPAGNECAVCHRDRGTFDGTFAHLYPLIGKHVALRTDAAPRG